MPLAAAAPFIGPIVGGVGSILGGVKGSNAASSAGAVQQRAAQQGMQIIQNALNQVNPPIQTAANTAATNALAAANTAGTNLTNVAGAAGTGVTNAAQAANAYLAPFLQTGTQANQMLANQLGQLTTPFTAQNMAQYNPGYQFTIDQANKALQSSAAARGGALGGGAASQLNAQTMQIANQQYTQGLQNYLAQNGQIYNMLAGQSAAGQQAAVTSGGNLLSAATTAGGWNYGAAGQAGNWLTQGTQYGGTMGYNAAQQIAQNTLAGTGQMTNLLTGGAAAQAAGIVGSANALNNMYTGLGNAAIGAGNIYNQQNTLNTLMNAGYNPYANLYPTSSNMYAYLLG